MHPVLAAAGFRVVCRRGLFASDGVAWLACRGWSGAVLFATGDFTWPCRLPLTRAGQVMIWDDHQNRCIGELSFRSEVMAVKLRRDRCGRPSRLLSGIGGTPMCAVTVARHCCCPSPAVCCRVVVVLMNKIYVYNFADLNLLHHVDTVANPKGRSWPAVWTACLRFALDGRHVVSPVPLLQGCARCHPARPTQCWLVRVCNEDTCGWRCEGCFLDLLPLSAGFELSSLPPFLRRAPVLCSSAVGHW